MSQLTEIQVVRTAGFFSKSEIEKKGFLSHTEELKSENYLEWCELAQSGEYENMIESMNTFLKSNKAIKSVSQAAPEEFAKALDYGMNHFDDFDTKMFLSHLNYRTLKSNVKVHDDGCIDKTLSMPKLLMNISDTFLAEVKTGNFINKQFNLQRFFKLTQLLIDAAQVDKKDFKLNITKYLEKPFVINAPCIMDFDPCKHKLEPYNDDLTENISDRSNEEKEDCGCNDLLQKEKECQCEKEDNDPCDCKCDDVCVEQNPCCAKITPYIAELFVVKDKLSCYKPGEISYIENVMKDEIRERSHRHLQREETYSEREEETETYEEKNHQIDQQFSLKKQMDKVVETDLSIDAGASYTAGGGLAPTKFTATLDTSFKQSRKNAQKMVKDESKKILDKAISKLQTNIRTLSSKKMINEVEEINKHTFGGSEGATQDMSRTFHFANLEKEAQVYSHGTRMMIDINLPEVSKRFKTLMQKEFDLKEPKKPCLKIEDINPKDYLKYIECYGFTDLEEPIPQPSVEWKTIFVDENTENPYLTIPEGYTATEMHMPESNMHKKIIGFHRFTLSFGGGTVERRFESGNTTINTPATILETNSGSIGIDTRNIKDFWAVLKFKLVPDLVNNLPWQIDVYNRILAKYQSDLEAYNRALEAFKGAQKNKYNKNSFMLKRTIEEQLKHQALEYITCQFFDEPNGMRYNVKPCGLPQMDLLETQKYGAKVKFFEQAFEWKFMNYMLYPYFYGKKCSWQDKLMEEHDNGLFEKFLQAGYASVTVAVRPGFEQQVNHYLATKQIWGGAGQPPLSGPTALPLYQEIKESKDNFNSDRDGHVICDTSLSLASNQIVIRNNDDYYSGLPAVFDSTLADADFDREIIINCNTYRILKIEEIAGEIVVTLDRDFDEDKDKQYPWSTGALFVGNSWKFTEPKSLVWLRENSSCLPCFPIKCEA